MSIEFKVCDGCDKADVIENAAGFVEKAKLIMGGTPPLIEAAVDLVAASEGIESEDKKEEVVGGVMDATAIISGVANMFDTELFESIEVDLASKQCNEGERLASPSRCPKADLLLQKMTTMATGFNGLTDR